MRWKEFLYFQRETKVAVILLLLLMVLTLILNIWVSRMRRSEMVLRENDSIVRAFEAYQEGLRLNDDIRSAEKERLKEGEDSVQEADEIGSRRKSEKVVKEGEKDVAQKGKESFQNASKRFSTGAKLLPGETISLNETDTAIWKRIPGIGSTFAVRIVKYRSLLGGFVRKEQLLEVYGMDVERYARIAPYIEEGGNYRKIRLNEWEFKALLRHPYLNYKQVQEVVNLRRKKGKITSLAELSMLDAFTSEDLYRLEPYIEF